MRRRLVCLPSSQLNRQQSVMYVAARLVRSAWKFRAHHAALRRLRAPRRNEFKIVPRVFRCPHSTATHQLARELHVAKSTRNGDYVLRRRRRSAFHRLVVCHRRRSCLRRRCRSCTEQLASRRHSKYSSVYVYLLATPDFSGVILSHFIYSSLFAITVARKHNNSTEKNRKLN